MEAVTALKNMGLLPELGSDEEGNNKLLQQAQQVWNMLDDLADNDPQGYQRFIQKQTADYKEMTAPPQPYMCVKTHFQAGEALYVNIMSWARIPAPKSQHDNIPLFAAPVMDDKKGERKEIATVSITTNPQVLKDCAKDRSQRPWKESEDSVLTQLSKITVCADGASNGQKLTPTGLNTNTNKKVLIEEIEVTENLITPKYDLHISEASNTLVLTVHLPHVTSVSQCQLDVSQDDVKLQVSDKNYLSVTFPVVVDDTKALARFSKKLSTLTLHVPVVAEKISPDHILLLCQKPYA
ncbi:PIH1 domain-containing protein 2-like [Pomacea canaliculata]|uniref:PIH1 domain-containing protein 2-like n=1 Tax=Pomacea canaliculata TaxID=400727 RepID=UPI000D7299FE|nr:PIH1 domain-containing protein 2-like [Pomacea canaliculata]